MAFRIPSFAFAKRKEIAIIREARQNSPGAQRKKRGRLHDYKHIECAG